MDIPVNYLAIFLAAVSNMVIGSIWYSPILFLNPWMKISGVKMGGKNPTPSYIIAFITALIAAYVLSHFIYLTSKGMGTELTTISAMTTAFWGWLGFVAPATAGMSIWEGKPWSYWAIVSGYWLASLVAMSAILSYWA